MNNPNENLTNQKNFSEIIFNSNPKDIALLENLTNDSYSDILLDNTFCVFTSINKIVYAIYSSEKKSIIAVDLNNFKKIIEIKNAHNGYITNFRYHFDSKNLRDLILSISSNDNNIKIWNFHNWDCLVNLKDVYKTGEIYSSCFLNENNQIYIVASNYGINSGPIKILDFNGKGIKDIDNNNEKVCFIDIYFDRILCKNYLIIGNYGNVKSYDLKKDQLYYEYYDHCDSEKKFHHSSVVINYKEIIELIESSDDGYIRIWNFHFGQILKKIEVYEGYLYGICLWNYDYLFVGCDNSTVRLVDLNNGEVIKELSGHEDLVLSIKKLIIPKYGECIISQGYQSEQIRLWIYKLKNE